MTSQNGIFNENLQGYDEKFADFLIYSTKTNSNKCLTVTASSKYSLTSFHFDETNHSLIAPRQRLSPSNRTQLLRAARLGFQKRLVKIGNDSNKIIQNLRACCLNKSPTCSVNFVLCPVDCNHE